MKALAKERIDENVFQLYSCQTVIIWKQVLRMHRNALRLVHHLMSIYRKRKRICETHVITDYTIQTLPDCLNPGSNWGPCVTSIRRAGATMRWLLSNNISIIYYYKHFPICCTARILPVVMHRVAANGPAARGVPPYIIAAAL
jgi:hypothetical protein